MAAARNKTCTFAALLIAQLLLTAISSPAGATPIAPLPTEGTAEAAAEDCWKAAQVLQADSCAIDVLAWLVSPDLAGRIGEECCTVLRTVGAKCLHDLFPDAAVGALYAPFVRHACGLDSP